MSNSQRTFNQPTGNNMTLWTIVENLYSIGIQLEIMYSPSAKCNIWWIWYHWVSLPLYYILHLLGLWCHRSFINSAGSQRTNTRISIKIMFLVIWSNHLCEMSFNRVLIMPSISTGQSFTYLNSKSEERERHTFMCNLVSFSSWGEQSILQQKHLFLGTSLLY